MQILPTISVVAVCLAGIGAVPYGVHKLFHWGEDKKLGVDRFDVFMMDRDRRIANERKSVILAAHNAVVHGEGEHHQQQQHHQ